MKIKEIRPVLLSAPYAKPKVSVEVDKHLNSGYKTIGMIEITLTDGTVGLGEAYIAVFAPKVFVEIANVIIPYLIGISIMDIPSLLSRIFLVTGYWSSQGAAQHVVSAFDIAFHDCRAKLMGIPVYKLYNENAENSIRLYGSGGDSSRPEYMDSEFNYLLSLGISHFKIRARNNQKNKAFYTLRKGKENNIRIAIDMTQNLANPGQTPDEVISFYDSIKQFSDGDLFFLEEVLGILDGDKYPDLKKRIPVNIAGGEIVTTSREMIYRIEQSWYDIVQPDATVIGGITAVLDVFRKAGEHNTDVFVHCWGGPAGMAANYHAALAAGGRIAEWPMPYYPLRDIMMVEPWDIKDGVLFIPDIPGLGVKLTREIENEFRFRPDAVYSCIPDDSFTEKDEIWI